MEQELKIIAWVRPGDKHRQESPKGALGADHSAQIVFEKQYLPALQGLQPGREYLVLTWMHQANRDCMQSHPREGAGHALQGVLCTTSLNRPNPIGLHQVRILQIQEDRLLVCPLDVLDQTPVLDIKPVLGRAGPSPWSGHAAEDQALQLKQAAHRAWQKGLLNGFNGNLSLKQGRRMIITCRGTAKAFIQPGDLVSVDLQTGETLCTGSASSEAGMHLQIYREQPGAEAVVHTHPPALLALDLQGRKPLDLDLFEAGHYQDLLGVVPRAEPGTQRLASMVGSAARDFQAVFMSGHGLTCWARSPQDAVALSEELEALARIQLACAKSG